ncbi:hypothetical protein RJ641_009953 [Dillenia turbinata]|uniref:Uncharacterized protein n=1 Tax=Dillenia turbinata TaxID=194707 RepID=A0AAN8UVD3_9MAGN
MVKKKRKATTLRIWKHHLRDRGLGQLTTQWKPSKRYRVKNFQRLAFGYSYVMGLLTQHVFGFKPIP